MAPSVTIANVLASGGTPSSGNNVTASWTPSTTKQYLLAITSYVSTGSASPVVSSVTGNGLTWTLIDTIQPDSAGADRSTLHVYAARGGGGSTGTITIAWSTAPTRASWSLDEVTNGDIGLGAGTLPQADASASSSNANPSATLGSALKSGSVTYAAAAFESSTGTLSAGSGYTALGTVTTQSLSWLITEWDSAGSTSASASNTTTTNRHGIIVVEIAVAAFAHVGSTLTWDASSGILLTPNGVGNLITFCELTKLASTPMLTNISSSNVTWTRLTPDFATSTASTPTGAAIWIGKVTSTSQASVTLTWAGGSEPAHWEAAVNEFESTFTDWALDTYGTIDSNSNVAYPSLTPAGSGELYVGTHYDDTGASVGSTAGYTYEVTSHGNGALYNAACTSSAQAPTWAGGSVMGGIAALIKQASTSDSGTADVTLKKMTVAVSGNVIDSGTADVTLKKMTVSGSGSVSPFSAVGSLIEAENSVSGTSTTFSLGTLTAGDFVLAEFGCNTSYVSALSSSRCTWTQIAPSSGAHSFSYSSPFNSNVWMGVVNSSGTDTLNVTFAASMGGASCRFDAREFNCVTGTPVLDTFDVVDSPVGTSNWASLTPSSVALYWGWCEDFGSAVSGSTPKFVYEVDSHGNASGYDLNVSSTYQPVWGDAQQVAGVMVLIKSVTSVAGTGAVTLQKMIAASSGIEKVSGTGAVTLQKMIAASSGIEKVSGTGAVTLKKMSTSPVLNANSGFESSTDPWLANGANAVLSQTSSWAEAGTYSAQVSVTASSNFPGMISEDITVPGNQDLVYKATIESPSVYDVQVGIHWYDSGRNFITSTYDEKTLIAGIAQAFGPNSVTSPSNAAIAVLFCQVDGTVPSGIAFNVDEIDLEMVSVVVLDKGTVSATLKKMTVVASGTAPVGGTSAVNLKKMTVFGLGKAKISGTIDLSLRKMTISGVGLAPIFGTVDVTMSKMQMYASDGHAVGASSLFIFMQP